MAEWLTLNEVATYLKRARSTLYRMVQRRELPASKLGRMWRFERDTIDEWLRRQPAQVSTSKAMRGKGKSSRDRL